MMIKVDYQMIKGLEHLLCEEGLRELGEAVQPGEDSGDLINVCKYPGVRMERQWSQSLLSAAQ